MTRHCELQVTGCVAPCFAFRSSLTASHPASGGSLGIPERQWISGSRIARNKPALCERASSNERNHWLKKCTMNGTAKDTATNVMMNT